MNREEGQLHWYEEALRELQDEYDLLAKRLNNATGDEALAIAARAGANRDRLIAMGRRLTELVK